MQADDPFRTQILGEQQPEATAHDMVGLRKCQWQTGSSVKILRA